MPDTQWLSTEEEQAWRGFLFAHLRLTERLARSMGTATDLNYTDYMILVALTDEPEGEMRLYAMSTALGWEKSRLSHHVTRMAARGLVERRECPDDHRGVLIAITDHGRDQLRAEAPHHVASVRRLFLDHLTPEQLHAFATLHEKVLPALNE